MVDRKILIFLMVIVLGFNVSAANYGNPSSDWQAQQPTFDDLYSSDMSDYWPILNSIRDGNCVATTDFVIGIPPGGCSPSVVRSDLLAEQNVPVFCQLYAIKINPLIKVSSIKSISFKGDYPEGVRSIVYHPVRAAAKSYSTLLGQPTLENIGYVVIILEQNKVEADMPEWVFGNLTATIRYDAEDIYGVGRGEYYLEDSGEKGNVASNSFWNGKGYLKATDIESGEAKIQVMDSNEKVVRSLNLDVGETSDLLYLPGWTCQAGLKVRLNGVVVPEDMALLNIDGENFWVRKGGEFLDGKCRVVDLDVLDNNEGSIKIKCSGTSGNIDLSLKDKGALLSVNGVDGNYGLGDRVGDFYLGYVGNIPSNFDKDKSEAVVLTDNMEDYSVIYSSIEELAQKTFKENVNFEDELKKVIDEKLKKSVEVVVIKKNVQVEKIAFLGADKSLTDSVFETGLVDTYFDNSLDTTQELLNFYRSEEMESGTPYGEIELWEEIVLAGQLGKFKTQSELMDLFVKTYPLSSFVGEVRLLRQKLDSTDFSNSVKGIYVGNEFKSISLVDFKVADEGVRKVDLKIGNIEKSGLIEGDNESMGKDKSLKIVKISPGEVRIQFESEEMGVRDVTVSVRESERYVFDGVEVFVENVQVDEVAYVSIIPGVDHTKTEADFSFRIGIEQRSIELSPERAESMIRNLDESIKKWEDRVERLGDLVTGMKGACFATSAVLIIKNMATGLGGGALARQKVMERYKVICDQDYPEKSRTQCYNDLESQINSDVLSMEATYNNVNDKLEIAQKDNTASEGGFFGGKAVVDNLGYRQDLVGQIDVKEVEVDLGGGEMIKVPVDESMSVSQLRSIMLWEQSGGSGVSGDITKAEMDSILRNLALGVKNEEINRLAAAELIGAGVVNAKVQSYVSKDATLLRWDEQKDGDKKIQYLNYNGKIYKLFLEGPSSGNLGVVSVERYEGEKWVVADKPAEFDELVFSAAVSGGCSNTWLEGTAKVSYYESGENKGLPAIVPFDLSDGWYAMVSNSGGTFLDDSPQGYTASGDVRYFKICNIGSNGVMQKGGGDDLCQSFDINTLGTVGTFRPCLDMTSKDVENLYEEAREAIRRASGQYGEKSINIFDKIIEVGEPMSAVGGFECQDFMSPSDCKIMFNVCDPVICPPSRCDLGGKMPVSDVIATGVIGSLTLCLPNVNDGVLIPICLSGVHAGLDSYLSILKSERDCLETSLETGELVGICDQITSIYKCEFFWKQLSPVMNQIVPRIIQGFVSPAQGVRGGGEYALVSQSWNAMQKNIDYFKNLYAQNAFRAFNLRSTEEVGSAVCNAFVGTSVPGSADIIDSLLEPESPSQFYAQFSEELFSGATVPATSQYKVYFHIYAGNDQGVQYKVYLKNPPATSYYQTTPTISVKSGYIAKGSSADESVDFTAPAGYKELCVVINAQEECGFKQVSTNFGVNWVADKYVEEQASVEGIMTEKECISGTPSGLSLVNLNVQEGVTDLINPEIAMSGVVRICASANPAAGVESASYVVCAEDVDCAGGYSCSDNSKCMKSDETFQTSGLRWKDVGYCGDVNLRCWLDTDSVVDNLENLEAISGTTNEILDERRGLIENERLSLEMVQEVLSLAREDIRGLTLGDLESGGSEAKIVEIFTNLDSVIGTDDVSGAGTNNDRAEALSLKASVWRILTGHEFARGAVKVVEPRPEVIVEEAGEDDNSNQEEVAVEQQPVEEKPVVNEECVSEVGEKIIEIASRVQLKKGISDAEIKSEGVADCFEMLALMIAMQESGIRHCEDDSKAVNCFNCGEDNLRSDYDPYAFGAMQININQHKDIDYGGIDSSVSYALEKILIDWGYKLYKDGRYFEPKGVGYVGWRAAIRSYNGWGVGGDDNYVENVLGQRDKILELFPDVCVTQLTV